MKLNLTNTRAAKFAAKTRAVQALWKKGEFMDMILNSYQRDMLKYYDDSDSIMFFLLCSRRLGKTWILCSAALRKCFLEPGSRVLYLSTTTDQVNEICDQTFPLLLESCPEEIRPEFKVKANKYIFPNGSEIRIKGLDKVGGDAIRGVKAHLVIFDEACFMKGINNIINSVVMPMVIATKGRILLGSTPPDTPGHDSIDIIARCDAAGACLRRDVYVTLDVLYSQKQIDEFIREAGGKDSSVCRREYFCEIVTEDTLKILPAVTDETLEKIVKETARPPYKPDFYVSMDIGFRDLTVILFGYWDYPRATLVVEDEIVFKANKASTQAIAESIRKKEKELWGNIKPLRRICDIDPRLIEDLRNIHKLPFKSTKKDNKEAQINQTNIMFINDQIEINPRCKTLISHIRYGVWNLTRTQYQRTVSMGHFDAVDALVYLVRNLKRNRNPIDDPTYSPDYYVSHGEEVKTPKTTALKLSKIFSRSRR